LIELG
jgi:hypothetical protein